MAKYYLLIVFAVTQGIYASSVSAQGDDARDCMRASGKARLEACERVIASKRWQGRELAWAYVNIGHYHDEAGDLDRSLEAFSEAIKLFPAEDRTFNNRGNIYLKKNDTERALKDFDEAIRLNPKNFVALASRARANLRRNNKAHALADANEAIRLSPEYPRAYLIRGDIHFVDVNRDAAILDYNKAIEFQKESFLTEERNSLWLSYHNRAMTFRGKGDFQSALADFNEAIRLNPNSALARANRGSLYEWRGDRGNALADYEAALALDPRLQQALQGRDRLQRK